MPDTPTPETPAELAAEPAAQWADPRVLAVYECLCSMEIPPAEQHWEGWTARRIVDRLANLAASSAAPDDTMTLQDVWDLAGGAHSVEAPSREWVKALLHELAAAPAAAERKPLTDQELANLQPTGMRTTIETLWYGRAVERAHGITGAPAGSEGE